MDVYLCECSDAGCSEPIDLTRLYSLLRVWMPNLDRI